MGLISCWLTTQIFLPESFKCPANKCIVVISSVHYGSTIQKFNPVHNLEFCSTSRVSQHKLYPEPFEATIMHLALTQNLNFESHAKGKRTHLWYSENEFYMLHLETILWITCSKIMESFTVLAKSFRGPKI
jgi:uncharacterized Zn-finger protein